MLPHHRIKELLQPGQLEKTSTEDLEKLREEISVPPPYGTSEFVYEYIQLQAKIKNLLTERETEEALAKEKAAVRKMHEDVLNVHQDSLNVHRESLNAVREVGGRLHKSHKIHVWILVIAILTLVVAAVDLWLHWSESASGTVSQKTTVRNPAASNPSENPPMPENRSR